MSSQTPLWYDPEPNESFVEVTLKDGTKERVTYITAINNIFTDGEYYYFYYKGKKITTEEEAKAAGIIGLTITHKINIHYV